MSKCLFLVFNCLIGFHCISQVRSQVYFEHYSQNKGLSQGSGYTAVQFDDFMWFGTQDGLNRFDGYDFKVYKSGNINASFIQTLLNDKKGHLWVGTSKGLNIYNPKKDTFQKFSQFSGQSSLPDNASVRLLMMDQFLNIWILTDEKGAFYYNSGSKVIKNYPDFSNKLIDITEGKDGSIFVATDNDVFKLDEDRQKFSALKLREVLKLPKKTIFRSVLADADKKIWIGTYEYGLYLLDNKNNKLAIQRHFTKGDPPENLSSNEITRMMQDSKGRIWIGTRTGGISLYNPSDQKFTHVVHHENQHLGISGNYVLSFSEDRQNNIWVGLSGSGFDKYDPRKYQFGLIRKDEKSPGNSLSDNMVFKIYGHNSLLYFGTQSGGLVRFDPLKNQYKTYKSDPDNEASLLHNEVYDISADKQGNLWLALGKGLCKFDPETQKFESFFREGQEELVYMYAVKTLKNNELWTGGQRGLFRFDLPQKKWKTWDNIPAVKAISKYVIRLIYEDSGGDIWLGTIGHGLLKFSPKTQKITRFDKAGQIDCSNIRAVFEDSHSFWIGSDCGAFEIRKANNKVLKHISDANGLPNNVVYSILKDPKGRLWFSTNDGLTTVNLSKNSFKNYNATDGLQANEFNTNCAFMTNDGMMYFGGVNGISYFKPESLASNSFVAPVRITGIKVMDQVYSDTLAIPYVQRINLPYDQNFIEFDFSIFNFSNSERNSYRYKLAGLEGKWVNAGKRRSANYTNLPPGDYTFMVKGSNNDGIENPAEAKISVHIHPPFWKTYWFISLLVLLFFGLVYLIYKNKINEIRKEERQRAEIKRIRTEAEMAILRAQISPDFIFNSLNAIEAYTLTNRRREASHYLQIFSKLLRQVLENSRQELVTVEEDIQALKLFVELEEERYDHVFKTEFDVDPSLIVNKNQIPPLLLQPFVENAILENLGSREEKGGILKIILKAEKPFLKVTIEDHVEGNCSAENTSERKVDLRSKSIYLTLKRIESLGNLYDNSTSSKITESEYGTRVELLLPLLDNMR